MVTRFLREKLFPNMKLDEMQGWVAYVGNSLKGKWNGVYQLYNNFNLKARSLPLRSALAFA